MKIKNEQVKLVTEGEHSRTEVSKMRKIQKKVNRKQNSDEKNILKTHLKEKKTQADNSRHLGKMMLHGFYHRTDLCKQPTSRSRVRGAALSHKAKNT